jgi:alcohol dehydrogenase
MLALMIEADRSVALRELPRPQLDGPRDVRVRMAWVALNRMDLFSMDGMAFATQRLPMIAAVEGAGVVDAVGSAVTEWRRGDRVVIYPGHCCGRCRACVAGHQNLCVTDPPIRGFHTDGVAAEYILAPATHLLPVPDGVRLRDAACVTVTAATVEHMLCDNAQLRSGETILVQAGGSGIGSAAIALAKHLGATIATTVGSEDKRARALALGADLVIDYQREDFSRLIRRWTGRRGVDVVFEHVGTATWDRSLRTLAVGGRLVTCGSHTGQFAQTDLIHLFNRQIRIFASFGSTYTNVLESLRRIATKEIAPTIDSELELTAIHEGLEAMRERKAFGKLVIAMPARSVDEELASSASASVADRTVRAARPSSLVD